MKRIISIILSLTLIISLVPMAVLATTNEETTETTKITKQKMAQDLHEKYGEDGILEDGVEYTWDCARNELTKKTPEEQVAQRWFSGENANNAEEKIIHDDIIDAANAEVYGESGTSYIPNMYLDLVKEANKKCDSIRHSTVPTEAEMYSSAVHGPGNYVITLRYLWQFALSLEPHKSEKTIDFQTLTTYINEAHKAGIKNIPSEKVGTDFFVDLQNFVSYMLTKHYADTSFGWVEGQHQGRRCKFIVIGIICHFLGDLYAHKSIVDEDLALTLVTHAEASEYGVTKVVYDETIHKNIHFFKGDFRGNSKYSDSIAPFEHYVLMKERIFTEDVHSNKAVSFSDLKKYYYADGKEAPAIVKQMLNQNYIDRGWFYYERIEEAILTTEWFLRFFNDGFYVGTIDPLYVNIKNFQTYIDDAQIEFKYEPV